MTGQQWMLETFGRIGYGWRRAGTDRWPESDL